MPSTGSKKHIQKRWQIIIMRPRGQTSIFFASPLFLLAGLFFGLIFTGVGAVSISSYFSLYPKHSGLKIKHEETRKALERVRDLYAYQTLNTKECQSLLYARPDNESPPVAITKKEEVSESGVLLPAAATPTQAPVTATALREQSVESWSSLFPDPPANSFLDVKQFEVAGRNFRFHLTNSDPAGKQARGHLLLLFQVKTGDKIVLIPFPEFSVKNPKPDFTKGSSYNIRSSKVIRGRLEIPPEGVVQEMMVLGQSQSGQIVLKKSVVPAK